MSEHETEKVVSVSVFKALIQLADQVKKRVQSANGELGERIKNAVDDGGLHAGAFKAIAKLNRADVMKRNDFLRSFDIYREYAEKHLWASDTIDMFDDKGGETGPEDEAAAAAAESEKIGAANGKKIAKGITQLVGEEEQPGGKKKDAKAVGFPGANGALN